MKHKKSIKSIYHQKYQLILPAVAETYDKAFPHNASLHPAEYALSGNGLYQRFSKYQEHSLHPGRFRNRGDPQDIFKAGSNGFVRNNQSTTNTR